MWLMGVYSVVSSSGNLRGHPAAFEGHPSKGRDPGSCASHPFSASVHFTEVPEVTEMVTFVIQAPKCSLQELWKPPTPA